MKNVRWVTALTGLGLVVAAFFSIFLSFSFSGMIICVYLVPIGFMITITETEKLFYARVIRWFPMLKYHFGRGMTYILVGGMCVSVGTIGCIVVGLALLAEGILSVMFHYNKDKQGETDHEQLEDGNQAAPNPAVTTSYSNTNNASSQRALPPAEPGSRSLSEVDNGADFGSTAPQHNNSAFGSSAAAAAFDYAANNPQQAQQAASAAYGFAKENPELAKKAMNAGSSAMV